MNNQNELNSEKLDDEKSVENEQNDTIFVYILERRRFFEGGESENIENVSCFTDIDVLHQWVRQNNQEYDKNSDDIWFFFASKELINGIISEEDQKFLLMDWNGSVIKE